MAVHVTGGHYATDINCPLSKAGPERVKYPPVDDYIFHELCKVIFFNMKMTHTAECNEYINKSIHIINILVLFFQFSSPAG